MDYINLLKSVRTLRTNRFNI